MRSLCDLSTEDDTTKGVGTGVFVKGILRGESLLRGKNRDRPKSLVGNSRDTLPLFLHIPL